jgi:hypothetical protein
VRLPHAGSDQGQGARPSHAHLPLPLGHALNVLPSDRVTPRPCLLQGVACRAESTRACSVWAAAVMDPIVHFSDARISARSRPERPAGPSCRVAHNPLTTRTAETGPPCPVPLSAGGSPSPSPPPARLPLGPAPLPSPSPPQAAHGEGGGVPAREALAFWTPSSNCAIVACAASAASTDQPCKAAAGLLGLRRTAGLGSGCPRGEGGGGVKARKEASSAGVAAGFLLTAATSTYECRVWQQERRHRSRGRLDLRERVRVIRHPCGVLLLDLRY